ncbi:MAG: hypothetical protein WKG00_31395 [Polyangiaceae bacterium]
MKRTIAHVVALTLMLGVYTVAPDAAAAGNWDVVAVYKNDDGTWTARLNDGQHTAEVTRNTKKKARAAGETLADDLNNEGCVDPCMFDPAGCGPGGGLAATALATADWEVLSVVQNPDQTWTATVLNDAGQGFFFVKSTQVGAATYGQVVADGFNGGQCTALP